MTGRVRRRWWLGLGVVVVVALAAVVGSLIARGVSGNDQCSKPVAERTEGWFCYEPDPVDGRPPPDGF